MNVLIFALLGGLLGGGLLGGPGGGFWSGAALGALAAWIVDLRKRVAALERDGAALRPQQDTDAPQREPRAAPPSAELPPAPAPGREPPAAPAAREPLSHAQSRPGPSLLERGLAIARRWLTTGNVPVKLGVVLSVFGAAFLVKEAIDRDWLTLPPELRLAAVALFGLALLGLGWRLRASHRVYALAVQGGGIAVLYLTIYASFALYGFVPAVAAFALLAVLTAAGGTLAVLQDARALAVLGIVGGFMAPVLTSSSAGNHVALFGYYALLDVAIFGIGSLWGYAGYRPELFATTEPFLVLFVLLYTLIPVLFALRQTPALTGFVDGTLVFGTPVVGFALQTRLVGDSELGLAASALALAALYVALATFLLRRGAASLRVLTEAFFGLGVAFLAIAVPLALDARWTSAAWALQGAALVWLGVRQSRRLPRAAGTLLQIAAGGTFAWHYFVHHLWTTGAALVSASGMALGAVLIALAGAFSSRVLDRAPASRLGSLPAAAFLAWGMLWWLIAGALEADRLAGGAAFEAFGLFVAATVTAVTLATPRLGWPRLAYVGLVGGALLAPGAIGAPAWQAHPLEGLGGIAWSALFAAHYLFLRRREAQLPRWQGPSHALAYWVGAYLLAWEAHWQIDRIADGVWPAATAIAAVAALLLATVAARERLTWPLRRHARTYALAASGVTLAVLLAAVAVLNVRSPGTAAPLPYVPLANPLELASGFALLVAVYWWRATPAAAGRVPAPIAATAAALGALLLVTMSVARAVHHFADVPFDLEQLAASAVLQAALSIVWGSAALAAMLIGARLGHRGVWLAGAALMAAVVVKLFLVELGNAGTVGRVVSFLGVGLLLLVVGYFAPAPPRRALEATNA